MPCPVVHGGMTASLSGQKGRRCRRKKGGKLPPRFLIPRKRVRGGNDTPFRPLHKLLPLNTGTRKEDGDFRRGQFCGRKNERSGGHVKQSTQTGKRYDTVVETQQQGRKKEKSCLRHARKKKKKKRKRSLDLPLRSKAQSSALEPKRGGRERSSHCRGGRKRGRLWDFLVETGP